MQGFVKLIGLPITKISKARTTMAIIGAGAERIISVKKDSNGDCVRQCT